MTMNGMKEVKMLKKARVKIGISQAKLSEITGISRHVLSSYELGKTKPNISHLEKILEVLNNPASFGEVISRKKRYRAHSFDLKKKCVNRESLCARTVGNAEYLENLAKLKLRPTANLSVLSLFAGIGGFSLGFRAAGFAIKGFVEIDPKLSAIYKDNFPQTSQIGADITAVNSAALAKFINREGNIDVVIGGPPCQGFSLSGNRDINDPRNYLFQDYLRVIDVIKPKVAVLENVRLLTSMKNKGGNLVQQEIESGFAKLGYKTKIFQVNAFNYGIPQHRERVIFVAIRADLNLIPSMPTPTHHLNINLLKGSKKVRTFADACSDLEYLESGECSLNDKYHSAVKHPDHVIEWLWNVKQGASAHDNKEHELRPPSGYNTTYKRQVWHEPAATVQTTFGIISGCRNVHPIATRSLTIREAARLQSFPDSFKYSGSLGTIRTGIGNAVSPLLAFNIGLHIKSLLLDLVKVTSL